MRFLFVILSLLFLLSFSYGQEYRLWNATIQEEDAGTTDSDVFNFTDRYTTVGKYFGLTAIVLDIDTTIVTKTGGNDSLYFVTMYKIGGTWFTGDTIQWDRVNTAAYGIDDTFIDTNIELVIAQTYQDSLLVWKNDPTSTTTIEGYPMWQEFGVRALYNDSIDVFIDMRAGRH